MMSDTLIERLRNWETVYEEDYEKPEGSLYLEAADYIEELGEKIRQLFAILEVTEMTDEGRTFHPTYITSCRAVDGAKMDTILADLKRVVTANDKENE